MPLFQNESGCKTFYVKMILIQHENERVGGSILITKVSPEDLPTFRDPVAVFSINFLIILIKSVMILISFVRAFFNS